MDGVKKNRAGYLAIFSHCLIEHAVRRRQTGPIVLRRKRGKSLKEKWEIEDPCS